MSLLALVRKSLFLFIAVMLCQQSMAQAVTVMSNSSAARDCYLAASRTTLKLAALHSDYETCTRALKYELLPTRDLAATHINRGIIRVSLEEYQDALADYKEALRVVPGMPEAHISIGNLWYLAGNYQRALTEYSSALQQESRFRFAALYNRGLAQEKLGNPKSAISDYTDALKLNPGFRQASERLAQLNTAVTP